MEINKKLKSEFKNYISDGLKIYFSANRPITEILQFLKIENSFIWDFDNRFLLSYSEITKEDLKKFELKQFDYNYMGIKDNSIIIDYYKLFDFNMIDLNLILCKFDLSLNDIKPYFKNWLNVNDLNKNIEIVKSELNKMVVV